MDAFTVLKVQIIGVLNTKTDWFLHQTNTSNSLENILTEIFEGNNPCFPFATLLELTGLKGRDNVRGNEFNTNVHDLMRSITLQSHDLKQINEFFFKCILH